jgi:NAD(P)-dependent dehydrogenase (short-subunit alcohol dehydrogenase family)
MANETTKKPAGKRKFRKELEAPAVRPDYRGTGKLESKIALITGGDSGIGRSVAVYFAKEGADVAVVYLESDEDAAEVKKLVEAEGRDCLLIKADVSKETNCKRIVNKVKKKWGRVDVLVNNAGTHEDDEEIGDISLEQLYRTFEVNFFSVIYLCKAALEIMNEGGNIINTTSVTAYRGSEHLLDYASTKGAMVSFTRSLAMNLAKKGIRVNAVAPGPIWTPLVIESFDEKHLSKFGKDTAMGRAGYPHEVATAYVYLASADSSYVTGQVLHVNGGDVMIS